MQPPGSKEGYGYAPPQLSNIVKSHASIILVRVANEFHIA